MPALRFHLTSVLKIGKKVISWFKFRKFDAILRHKFQNGDLLVLLSQLSRFVAFRQNATLNIILFIFLFDGVGVTTSAFLS